MLYIFIFFVYNKITGQIFIHYKMGSLYIEITLLVYWLYERKNWTSQKNISWNTRVQRSTVHRSDAELLWDFKEKKNIFWKAGEWICKIVINEKR